MLMKKIVYEEKILSEIKTLPEEALPKVLKLLFVIKDEFITQEKEPECTSDDIRINHAKTKRILSPSHANWAHAIIAEREERL